MLLGHEHVTSMGIVLGGEELLASVKENQLLCELFLNW